MLRGRLGGRVRDTSPAPARSPAWRRLLTTHGGGPAPRCARAGNTTLNRALRAYFGALGVGLDDKQLGVIDSAAPRDPRDKTGWTSHALSAVVPVRSEFDVFSYAGLRFIPPQERSCFSTHFGLAPSE